MYKSTADSDGDLYFSLKCHAHDSLCDEKVTRVCTDDSERVSRFDHNPSMDRAPIHTASSDAYANLGSEVSEIVGSYPPPFVYVHDPHTTRIATSTVVSTLSTLRSNGANIAFAHVNAVACFTPRLLYDTALNALAGWSPDWEDGCANWTGPLEGTSQRFNESFDGFTHGIRAVYNELLQKHEGSTMNGKGKNKATVQSLPDLRLVLVIEDAERLKENMPDILAPLTRLHELVSF